MNAALAAVAILALAALLGPVFGGWLERRRLELPRVTALCMDFETPRQARLELRIDRPATTSDWSIRRIEWLEPADASIAPRQAEASAGSGRIIETRLGSGDPLGRWFDGDPTLWVRYPRDSVPVHQIRLRLTFDRPGGRRRRVIVSEVLPAMSWRSEAGPRRRLPVTSLPRTTSDHGDKVAFETRSWRIRDWDRTDAPGLA